MKVNFSLVLVLAVALGAFFLKTLSTAESVIEKDLLLLEVVLDFLAFYYAIKVLFLKREWLQYLLGILTLITLIEMRITDNITSYKEVHIATYLLLILLSSINIFTGYKRKLINK